MTAYRRGRAFEYRVRRWLEVSGWWVARVAGSKGVADLVALSRGEALLVQCKLRGVFPLPSRRALVAAAEVAGARPILADAPRRGEVRLRRVFASGYGEYAAGSFTLAEVPAVTCIQPREHGHITLGRQPQGHQAVLGTQLGEPRWQP